MFGKKLFSIPLFILVSLLLLCTKVSFDELPTTPSVIDITAPVITISGDNPDTIQFGVESYLLPEVSAYDSVDGDLSDSIVVTGTIDTAKVGVNYKYYQVSDGSGNIGYDTLVVVFIDTTIVDSTAPVITFTGKDTVKIAVGAFYTDQGYSAISENANITSLVKISYFTIDGIAVDSADIGKTIGNYKVKYFVQYASKSTTKWKVIIVTDGDITPPIITILGKNPDTLWTWQTFVDSGAIAIDSADDTVSVTVTVIDSLVDSIAGSYQIIYTATDKATNSSQAIRKVVVFKDTVSPTLTISYKTDTLEIGDDYTAPVVTAYDSVDGSIGFIINTGTIDTTVAGVYTLIYSASDNSNNSSNDTVVISVFAKPELKIIGINPDTVLLNSANYIDLGAKLTDNIDLVDTIFGTWKPALDLSIEATYQLIYRHTDIDGNVADSLIRTVVVKDGPDSVAPVISIPAPNPDTIEVGETFDFPTVTALDAKDGAINPVKTGAVDSSVIGINKIAYTATDNSGNVSTDTLTVVVVDITAPIITISGANPLSLNEGYTYTEPSISATDGVDGNITANIVKSGDTVNSAVPGSYKVIFTVLDASGNTDTDTLIVNVIDDAIAPVLSGVPSTNPDTILVGDSWTEPTVTAIDNVDTSVAVVKTGSVNSSVTGSYSLIFSATDSAGNNSTDTLVIVVKSIPDVTPPVITIAGSNPLSVNEGYTYTEPSVTAMDIIDGNLTDSIKKTGDTVDNNTPGTYKVIFTVTDAASNIAIDTLVVNVIDDAVAPVLSGMPGTNPDTIWVGDSWSDPTITATDNVDASVTVIKTGGVNVSTANKYLLIYSATDIAGNSVIDTLVVVVKADTEAPVITISGSNPDTITVGDSWTENVVTATDSKDGNLTGSIVKSDSTVNPSSAGNYHIIYTVTDAASNVAKDTLIVVIKAASAPSGTFTLTYTVGASEAVYDHASKPYQIGAYGAPYTNPAWEMYTKSTSSDISGSISSIDFTFNSVVWGASTPTATINVKALSSSGTPSGSDAVLHTFSASTGASSLATTWSGSNLENYFNGTTAYGVYFEYKYNYQAYWFAFDSISITLH